VCAQKTRFLAQRALRRKPGVSADYPGFFINTQKLFKKPRVCAENRVRAVVGQPSA
jgi:hypothetical protein